jgi:hypothetical protein
METVQRNTELLSTAYRLYQLEQVYKSKENKPLQIEKKQLAAWLIFIKTSMLLRKFLNN